MEESSSVAERFIEAFNSHDPGLIGVLLSDTILVSSPEGPVGPFGWRARSAEHFREFPDSALRKVRISGQGSTFIMEVIWTGTMAKSPPTAFQTHLYLSGLVKNGRIETLQLEYDAGDVRRQLGVDR